jgi:hypothetical protein
MAGLPVRIDFAKMTSALQLVADKAVIQAHQVKRSVNIQQRSKAGRSKVILNLRSFMKNGKS